MLLYKYKTLENLWYILDIIINQRLYCAHWTALNDPLEGRYSFFFINDNHSLEEKMRRNIEHAKDKTRISALSKNYKNFLLWSHYANGHKGVAIEINLADDCVNLAEVTYIPFSAIFGDCDEMKRTDDVSHIFKLKSMEWKYEEEYRIIIKDTFYPLPNPIRRIYLGPLVSSEQNDILREILPPSVEIIETKLNYYQGWIEEKDNR